LEEGSPVNVVAEGGGFAIAAVHDVVKGHWILDRELSGDEEMWSAPCNV